MMGGFLFMVNGILEWHWGYYPNPLYRYREAHEVSKLR